MNALRTAAALTLVFSAYFSPSTLTAATYYVATSGGDDTRTAAQAQSISTPWKTIQKAASSMTAGDICEIRAGTYPETVTVPVSGTTSAPILFRAYGNETVTISGTDPVSGWTLESTNIWYAPMTGSLGEGNQVFAGGAMKPQARWPNAGATFPWQDSTLAHPTNGELGDWSYANTAGRDANGANAWFTDPQLPSRPDGYWNGATVHMMSGHGWIMRYPVVTAYTDADRKIVTNDSGSGAYAVSAGNEYYLTGKKGEMDSAGEWFYDTALSRLYYYSTTTPANIEAKKRRYGFNLSGRSYVQLINLDFFACTIQTDANSANVTLDGLYMRYLGHDRKDASVFGLQLRNGFTLRNSELTWDSRGLVQILGSDVRIINNHLHDSGYNPTWDAMVSGSGYRNLVSHNTLRAAGRGAMGFPGRASIVQYNDMYDAMRLTSDGSIFYTYAEGGNTIVRYNLMHDSPGPVGHSGFGVNGFYLDCQSSSWIVHHNIIWNLPGYAMWLNARMNFQMVFNNSCWNTAAGGLGTSFNSDGETGSHIYNNLFNGPLAGNQGTWGLSNIGYNLHTDPQFVAPASRDFRLQSTSAAIDQGTLVPGVTDGFLGNAPDMGAIEYGTASWLSNVGYKTTPPSPDPVYSMPAMIFANQVKDGSFETGSFSPNWTVAAGSNVSLLNSNAWTDSRLRSGSYGAKFGQGTSEIRQTVPGLQPGSHYRVFVGSQTADATASIIIGVRNHGFPAMELDVIAGSGAWRMESLPFFTGGTNTSAEIYVKVVSASATVPVYVDDISVQFANENTDPQPYSMPIVSYAFDETTGLTAYDQSTNGRNATLTNTTFTAGVRGNAVTFTGSGSGSTSLGATAFPTASFTVAFWVKFDDSGTGTPQLASNNNNAWAQKGWYITGNEGRSIGMYLWNGVGGGVSSWTGSSAPGTWTHLAYAVDRTAGVVRRYRNGVLEGSTSIPAGFGGVDTTLGLRIGSTSFKGQLDDFHLWDYALSGSEIADLVDPDDTLLVRLKLDESTGATKAWDATGHGRHGTLTSMNTSTCWTGESLKYSAAGYVQCPPLSTAPWPTDSFSVSFWVKFDDSGTGTPALTSNNNNGWTQKGWYICANEPRMMGLYLWNGTTGISSWTSAVPVGTWVHMTYIVDRTAGVIRRYRNGAAESTVTIPSTFGGIETAFGPRFGSPTLKGELDDVRIYSRVLSAYEVMEISQQFDLAPYE